MPTSCPSCRAAAADDDVFCMSCGTRIVHDEPAGGASAAGSIPESYESTTSCPYTFPVRSGHGWRISPFCARTVTA